MFTSITNLLTFLLSRRVTASQPRFLGPLALTSIVLLATTLPEPLLAENDSDLLTVQRFTDGDTGVGKKLYKRYCRGCHGKDGRGGAHTFMPHVHNLTKKDYIEFIPDGFLYHVIAEGGEAVGKNSYMPAWKNTLSTQEIKDVIAFIRTMPTH